MIKKKFLVFISSTYKDLQEERQSAVEAILTAGHIPAGMELFTAGDDSQMAVIKRWIDESDVFMLILGGRYGSIEPKSKKSYIQIEYEYALAQNKPIFVVVIDEKYLEKKVRKIGTSAIELDHPDQLKKFRELVCKKMVKFWKDSKDIKLFIYEALAEFSNRKEIIGWIPGDQAVDSVAVTDEITRLIKENTELREQINILENEDKQTLYGGIRYFEMINILSLHIIDSGKFRQKKELAELAKLFGHKKVNLLHYLWIMSREIDQKGVPLNHENIKLLDFGLIKLKQKASGLFEEDIYTLTEDAKRFLMKLRVEYNLEKAEKLII